MSLPLNALHAIAETDPFQAARISIAYFDAGGGHRSAATALKSVIEKNKTQWTVELVNLQEVLDAVDPVQRLTGIRLQDVYNRVLAAGWTLGSPQLLPLLHLMIRMRHSAGVREMAKYWSGHAPDMLISVVPNLNRVLAASLRQAAPQTPFVTILTDLADYPPHFWMERESEYVICGSERALRQAQAMGLGATSYQVSGMILHPKYYGPLKVDRAAALAELGLRPDIPTGLVLFGGHGSRRMSTVAKSANRCTRELQLIFICGHNQKIATRLRGLDVRYPKAVMGFTQEVPRFMAISDFFIGKPGPGSISEAVHMGLPVVVERNAWTLPQERYNAEWVREKSVGLVLQDFSALHLALDEMLQDSRLQEFQKNTRALRNRAVFEIPELLEDILAGRMPAPSKRGAIETRLSSEIAADE